MFLIDLYINKIKKWMMIGFNVQKGYKKIKLNSEDNLPLNKQLKFYTITVTIRYVFSKENKLYPRTFYFIGLNNFNVRTLKLLSSIK